MYILLFIYIYIYIYIYTNILYYNALEILRKKKKDNNR